ncbi:MAG: hypothetical protein WCQ32_01410 [bacterium]
MKTYDFLVERKNVLFEKTPSSFDGLIPNFISTHAVPVLEDYKTYTEKTTESEKLSAEKFLDNHLYQEAFIDFKCYWKMIDLMEEFVKN